MMLTGIYIYMIQRHLSCCMHFCLILLSPLGHTSENPWASYFKILRSRHGRSFQFAKRLNKNHNHYHVFTVYNDSVWLRWLRRLVISVIDVASALRTGINIFLPWFDAGEVEIVTAGHRILYQRRSSNFVPYKCLNFSSIWGLPFSGCQSWR